MTKYYPIRIESPSITITGLRFVQQSENALEIKCLAEMNQELPEKLYMFYGSNVPVTRLQLCRAVTDMDNRELINRQLLGPND